MSLLSDRSIINEINTGRIKINPFEVNNVQPASVDLRLGNKFRVFAHLSENSHYIDTKNISPDLTNLVIVGLDEPFILQSGQFALGTTLEYVSIPDNIVGRIEGRSSLGRLGLLVHATAGYIDPGFRGTLTLELSNLSPFPIAIYPNSRICQVSFQYMSTPVNRMYGDIGLGSKYQNQQEPAASKGT